MKNRASIFLILVALGCQNLFSQSIPNHYTRNCLYAELLGQGILYSVNYEHRFIQNLSARIGFTTWGISNFPLIFAFVDINAIAFPLMINYLSGSGNAHLELGLGAIVGRVESTGEDIFFGTKFEGDDTFILGTATIGFRHQPTSNGFLFRIGLTPIFNSEEAHLSGGVSFGYAF